MDYGKKISYLRKSNGMTQEELGKVLNVTYQAVSKWERGESMPDFATMSQIAKHFQVPLSYFADGNEEGLPEAQTTEAVGNSENLSNIVGTCTECGRLLTKEDGYVSSPKLMCSDCSERIRREKDAKIKEENERLRRKKDYEVKMQRGGGFDTKLAVSLIFTVVAYILFTVLCFTGERSDREFMGTLLFIIPLAVFGFVHAVSDMISDLRSVDGPDGYTRNLSLVIGAVFALINIALFLLLYFTSDSSAYFLVMLFVSAILSFTFISQFMWGSAVKEIFTCGGFTFKLPGFIFSLTVESILWMIITKIFLGIISIALFLVTTVLFAIIAILGSVFTFIPCVIYKTVKDKSV